MPEEKKSFLEEPTSLYLHKTLLIQGIQMLNIQFIITKYGNNTTFKTLPFHNFHGTKGCGVCYYSYYPVDKFTFTRT